MKTSRKIISLLVLACSFFIFGFTEPKKAPCPYQIGNGLNCPVTVDITIYNTPPTNCTNVCNTIMQLTLVPGQIFNIPCCPSICNIEVSITKIGGAPITFTGDFTNTTPTAVPGTMPPCPTANFIYSPTAFKIFP